MTTNSPADRTDLPLTATHWGNYRVEVVDGKVAALHPFEHDPDPSPIGEGIIDAIDSPSRIMAPAVRKSWLEGGPGAAGELRGSDPFVEVSWEVAEQLVADELERVRTDHGNEAIYAGSYGWASAGRFHHAQSQLKSFLNCIGGFTRSVNTYSFAAAEVTVPHVLGSDVRHFAYAGPTWSDIIANTELLVAFGGVRVNNGQISQGGGGQHVQRIGSEKAAQAGVSYVNVSPLRSDVIEMADAQWVPLRPSTDTALMLGLSHTLLAEGLHDQEFLDRYSVGFHRFAAYLHGEIDGVEKTAEWAARTCDLDSEDIRSLARRMAESRTLISIAWALTRQQHGEQTWWAAIALASMLGQIGLPGQGIALGLSSVNTVGHLHADIGAVPLPQGQNPIDSFIPVARVADMLLNPGTEFEYDGHTRNYPDAKLVWWAGGNPYHHHQDLNRLVEAWQRPETIIVNDWCWNATARRADIVLPCTTNLERSDLSLTYADGTVTIMSPVIDPVGESRNDRDILRGVARRMGVEYEFTQGLTDAEWIDRIYETTQRVAADRGLELPSLSVLEEKGWHEVKPSGRPHDRFGEFRADPEGNRLGTPSGRIELFSEAVAAFGYDDAPGYAAWFEPTEWLGAADPSFPLHAITNQPTAKLHSHLDQGSVSRAAKIDGREPIVIHPRDAASRGIEEHDLVRVFSERGSCLAAAVLSTDVRPYVVQMSTGAWFDPVDLPAGSTCVHGNPNTFTADIPTSRLAQGCTAHTCMVQVERFEGEAPPVTAFDPPVILRS
ncbi:MAG: molybdopterin-dependent oxidoreductase [Acidimicrobiales bacterium]